VGVELGVVIVGEVGAGGVMMMIGTSAGGAVVSMVTAPPRMKASALLPGAPLLSPSIGRPNVSSMPESGLPKIVSSTARLKANGVLGVRMTVSFAGSNTADRSFITGELPDVNDPLPFAATSR
jgi:hypothetical protein